MKMKMKILNFKITTLGFAVSVCLALVTAVVVATTLITVRGINDLGSSWIQFESGPEQKNEHLQELEAAIGYGGVIHQFKNYILRQERMRSVEFQSKMRAATAALKAYQAVGANAKERAALRILGDTLTAYDDALAVVKKLSAEGKGPREIDKLIKIDDVPAIKAIATLEKELYKERHNGIEIVYKSVDRLTNFATYGAIVIGLLLTSLLIFVCWFASFRLSRPLRAMVSTMAHLADGDRVVEVPAADHDDEIGEMAKALQVFKENKDELVRNKDMLTKQSALLESTMRHMDQGIIVFDADFKILAANARVAQVIDMPQSLFEVGQDFRNIIYETAGRGDYGPGDPKGVAEQIFKLVQTRKQVQTDRRLPDGRIIAVRQHPLPEGGAVITYSDITENILTRDRLGRTQKMEAVGLLAGNIAHEFNNLLTSISGFTRMAMKKPDDAERVHDCLEEVIAAADRAADVTGQMLSFSSDRRSKSAVVDAGGVVLGLEKMLRMSVESTVDLRIDASGGAADGEAPVAANIEVDSTRLAQSLLNLVINGCHAMPQGGELSLGFSVVDVDLPKIVSHGDTLDPGRYVCYSVTDTGIGIDPDIVGKIFDPFFTMKDETKGTGLGLAYVYGTISQANGGIDVESKPGEGTRFTLYLPVTDKEIEEEELDLGDGAARKKLEATVLVAEDDPQLREYLRLGLEDMGLTVLTAPDGVEAERLYNEQAESIDLLITDVVMPCKTGVKLVESLQADYPDLRTIFITGYAPELSDHMSTLNESATVLSKPFTPEALIETLRNKLDA